MLSDVEALLTIAHQASVIRQLTERIRVLEAERAAVPPTENTVESGPESGPVTPEKEGSEV